MEPPHDPELLRQLKESSQSGKPIRAWFKLRDASASDMEAKANELLTRAARETGQEAQAHNVLRRLGTVIVQAHPSFIETLMRQPEIESSGPTDHPGVTLIPPVVNSTDSIQ